MEKEYKKKDFLPDPPVYRVWDLKKEKMYSPEQLEADNLSINPNGKGVTKFPHFIPMKRLDIKDRKGESLFVGDIVLIDNLPSDIPVDVSANIFMAIKSEKDFYRMFYKQSLSQENIEKVGHIFQPNILFTDSPDEDDT